MDMSAVFDKSRPWRMTASMSRVLEMSASGSASNRTKGDNQRHPERNGSLHERPGNEEAWSCECPGCDFAAQARDVIERRAHVPNGRDTLSQQIAQVPLCIGIRNAVHIVYSKVPGSEIYRSRRL